jgi:hypothetical protein
MAHFHDFNPWADRIVYVPNLEEFAACLDIIGKSCLRIYPGGREQRFIMTVKREIANWRLASKHRGNRGKLDAYILPQPSGSHSVGIRYGKEPSEYYSPEPNQAKIKKLLNKYGPKRWA